MDVSGSKLGFYSRPARKFWTFLTDFSDIKTSVWALTETLAVTLSTDTVRSSNAFHKSTTLALKNFCPSVPFLFLNNLYLCPRVALLGANSKNLSHCIDSFPVIIL